MCVGERQGNECEGVGEVGVLRGGVGEWMYLGVGTKYA